MLENTPQGEPRQRAADDGSNANKSVGDVNRMARKQKSSAVSPARHESQCSICAHGQRQEIDWAFESWTSPTRIATEYKVSRDSVYRHARATGLLPKSQKNVRTALEKVIEQAGEVEVNAAAVVSAVSAYSRINSSGLWVERSETVDLNQLFDRMTRDELDTYARDGTLPDWFPAKSQQEA